MDFILLVLKFLENGQDLDKENVDWKEIPDAHLVLKACCILYVLCPNEHLKRFLEPEKIISSLKNHSCENIQLVLLFLKSLYKNDLHIIPDERLSSKIVDLLGQLSGIKELESIILQITSALHNSTSIVEVMKHLSEEDQEEELILFRGHGESEFIFE